MGTTAEKLQRVEQTKADLKTAIEAKGVTVGDIPFKDYPTKVGEIKVDDGVVHFKMTNKMSNPLASLSDVDFTGSDMSSVHDMTQWFGGGVFFDKTIDFSNQNLSNVTTMTECFKKTIVRKVSFANSGLGEKLTNAVHMFIYDNTLKEIDFTGCDFINASVGRYFFNSCFYLKRAIFPMNFASKEFYLQAPFRVMEHDSILDLFNKLAVRTNSAVLELGVNAYDKMTADEIKIATDKGWTVSRVEL